jgi:hypothetical protein
MCRALILATRETKLLHYKNISSSRLLILQFAYFLCCTGIIKQYISRILPFGPTGRMARLFCTALCTCTEGTNQGLANGKIEVCSILKMLSDAARDRFILPDLTQ